MIPSYEPANTRLSWDDPLGNDGITVSVFVKNVFDKLYFIGGSAAAQATSLEYADLGQPRTYGIVATYEF